MPVLEMKRITRKFVRANKDKLFIFGDNMARFGLGGQAREMRGEPNAVGFPTKNTPAMMEADFFTDKDLNKVMSACHTDIIRVMNHLRTGGDLVVPEDGIGTGLAQLATRAPLILNWYRELFEIFKVTRPTGAPQESPAGNADEGTHVELVEVCRVDGSLPRPEIPMNGKVWIDHAHNQWVVEAPKAAPLTVIASGTPKAVLERMSRAVDTVLEPIAAMDAGVPTDGDAHEVRARIHDATADRDTQPQNVVDMSFVRGKAIPWTMPKARAALVSPNACYDDSVSLAHFLMDVLDDVLGLPTTINRASYCEGRYSEADRPVG